MRSLIKAAIFAALVGGTGAVHAGAVLFDFAAGRTNNTQGPHSLNVNGVIARAYDNNNFASPDLLWFRNVTNDHGIGVCDVAIENCGPGDLNELDNVDSLEIITLENTHGGTWEELWVSSLDGNETGSVFWSHTFNSFSNANQFSYTAGVFGSSVEGDILSLAAASGFDPTAPYLAFIAGTFPSNTAGTDNDYLIWKGRIEVPEPATLGLLGLSLIGAGVAGRRRSRR